MTCIPASGSPARSAVAQRVWASRPPRGVHSLPAQASVNALVRVEGRRSMPRRLPGPPPLPGLEHRCCCVRAVCEEFARSRWRSIGGSDSVPPRDLARAAVHAVLAEEVGGADGGVRLRWIAIWTIVARALDAAEDGTAVVRAVMDGHLCTAMLMLSAAP